MPGAPPRRQRQNHLLLHRDKELPLETLLASSVPLLTGELELPPHLCLEDVVL